jgi:hypothetical protein
MLVFGIRVLLRGCEADMHEVRRVWNNHCRYYHRTHGIFNEKVFLSLSV